MCILLHQTDINRRVTILDGDAGNRQRLTGRTFLSDLHASLRLSKSAASISRVQRDPCSIMETPKPPAPTLNPQRPQQREIVAGKSIEAKLTSLQYQNLTRTEGWPR